MPSIFTEFPSGLILQIESFWLAMTPGAVGHRPRLSHDVDACFCPIFQVPRPARPSNIVTQWPAGPTEAWGLFASECSRGLFLTEGTAI